MAREVRLYGLPLQEDKPSKRRSVAMSDTERTSRPTITPMHTAGAKHMGKLRIEHPGAEEGNEGGWERFKRER